MHSLSIVFGAVFLSLSHASAASFPVLECAGERFHFRAEITRDDGGETEIASGTVAVKYGMPGTQGNWKPGISDRMRAGTKDLDSHPLRTFFGNRAAQWRSYPIVYFMNGSHFPNADQALILPVKPGRFYKKGPFRAAMLQLPEMANPFWQPLMCEVLPSAQR